MSKSPSEKKNPFYVEFLKAELERRKAKNARYSLRAFASALEMHPSALSRILNGQQELSLQACLTAIPKIKMVDEEKRLFLASVAEEKMYRAAEILANAANLPEDAKSSLIAAPDSRALEMESLLKQSTFKTALISPEGRYLFVSAPSEFVPFFDEKTVGKTVREAGLNERLTTLIEEQDRWVMKSGNVSKLEFAYPDENGPQWFERIVRPIRRNDGSIESLVSNLHDITPRKREEIMLAKNLNRTERLQKITALLSAALTFDEVANTLMTNIVPLVGAMAGSIGMIDPSKMLLRLIPTQKEDFASPLYEIDLTDPRASAASEAYRTKSARFVPDLMAAASETKTASEAVKRGARAGAILPLMIDGEMTGVLNLRYADVREFGDEEKAFLILIANQCAIALDRARLYENERARRNHAETITDALPHLVWLFNADGTLDYSNKKWEEFRGVREGQLNATDWAAVVHPEDFPAAKATWDQMIRGRNPFETKVRFLRKDGEYRWYICQNIPLIGKNNEVEKWVSTGTEIPSP